MADYILSPTIDARLEIIRRIIERGLSHSLPMGYDSGCSGCVDLFQHLHHELQSLTKELNDVSLD